MMAKFAWLIVFAFGVGLGAVLMWLRQGDLIGKLSKALNKCQRDKQELLANIAALDDELDDCEADAGALRALIPDCYVCGDPVVVGERFETTYTWPETGGLAVPHFKCENCCHASKTREFSAVEA